MGPRRDNKSEGVAFVGIENEMMEEDGRGKNEDDDDVTENERNSANPKTEGYLIGINPPCKRAARWIIYRWGLRCNPLFNDSSSFLFYKF